MKENLVKCKFVVGELIYGMWLLFGDFYVMWVFVCFGFDWLMLDMEYLFIDWWVVVVIFGVIVDVGCVLFVWVLEGNYYFIKCVFDVGVWGIVVLMVDIVE